MTRTPARHHADGSNPADSEAYPVRSQTYEITFTGPAGTTLRAAFDDCEITTGPDTTTLRAQLPDQAALVGLIQRINGLRLEIIHLQRLTPPPGE
jgi:hypothetical protein